MIIRIICFNTLLMIAACGQSEKPDTTPVTDAPAAVEEDLYTPVMLQLGKLVKPSYSAYHNFNEIFNCILIDEQGSTKPVSDLAAIDAYLGRLEGESGPHPVFEVKDTDQVVLLLKDKKAWAQVLLDKQTLTLIDIQFPKGSEIAKLKGNTEKFRQQLVGAALTFTEDNFELTPWDSQIKAKGDVVIDGISGATTICQAAVDLLNQQLPVYRSYLESS